MAFNDDLKLAIASTAKLEEFARSLSKTRRPASNTRQQSREPNRASEQQASFLRKLADRLHAVRDWLETLSGSENTQNSKVVKLLSNLDRLCVRPWGKTTSSNRYDGLRNLRKVEDTLLIKIARETSSAAEKRRQDLLHFLDKVSLAPSTVLRDGESFDGPEVPEKALDFWFPKRLDSLYTVLDLHRSYGSVEPSCDRKLVARMCLSNSKMADNKCLQVGMLLASSGDVGSLSQSRWKEAQIGVFPREAQLHMAEQRASEHSRSDVEPLDRDESLHLTTVQLHQMLQEEKPPSLCLQVHDQTLISEQGSPRDISNYIMLDRPSVCLTEILHPDLMKQRKRLYVSHLLAHAFWQCYGSRWMEDAWTKLRIHFMYTMIASQGLEPQLFAHQPFLTVDFAEREKRILSRNTPTPSRIQALGIMLLEIELGTQIDSRWPPAFLNAGGEPNTFTDLCTAQILVPKSPEEDKELKERETYPYLRGVIRKCLYATEFKNCQNSDQERELIYRDILAPLQHTLTVVGGDDDRCEEIRLQPLQLRRSAASERTESITCAPSAPAVGIPSNYHNGERLGRGQAGAKLFDCLHACTEEEGNAADDWLENVAEIRKDCFDPRLIRRRIRIAILDTGIDFGHTFFSEELNRIAARESFLDCRDPNSLQDNPRNTKDTHGHGTHIAGIILQVAPDADLYIGRVVCGDDPTRDDAQQITKGIRWAIRQGVDIITMSLGFDHPQGEICKAITEAYGQNILVFASASNSGANPIEPIAHPARMPTVFCISATDAYGNKLTTSPPAQTGKENFSVIGAGINSSWPADKMERKSGTSFATPIAAGLAALVLEYANQRNMATPGAFSEQEMRTLHTREGMAMILEKMGKPKAGEFQFLRPWALWGNKARRKLHGRVTAVMAEMLEGV
ncbi:subtilisin-like protein [Cadophora sp. DSE1049]|nr:subtilisin-like protein [Cadophora sp. DSE1049]